MPSLKDLAIGHCNLKVKYGDETISVVYRPSWYDADVERALDKVKESVYRNYGTQLCAMLVSWDVTETEGGEPIPLTLESLEEHAIPLRLLTAIISAVGDDNTVPKRKPKGS